VTARPRLHLLAHLIDLLRKRLELGFGALAIRRRGSRQRR
jgi:hypothetical protein